MSKEQKIKKIFKTDEEIANEMLQADKVKKEKREQEKTYRRYAHVFGIHYFSKEIDRDGTRIVKKCEFCGLLKLTDSYPSGWNIAFGLGLFLISVILAFVGFTQLIFCMNQMFVIHLILGILGFYYTLKRFFERIWMDEYS